MGHEMLMELRRVDPVERVVVGVVAPYDEISYLTPHIEGERIRRGAFARSIAHHRRAGIPLLRNHDMQLVMGYSSGFADEDDGLVGTFKINEGDQGDTLLTDVRHGYLNGLSVGFQTIQSARGTDGVREVTEARLVEVSMCGLPAYEGAALLAVRNAQSLDDILAPFLNRPDVNLDPLPAILYSHIR
jgi:HK97 family phage prohead protease